MWNLLRTVKCLLVTSLHWWLLTHLRKKQECLCTIALWLCWRSWISRSEGGEGLCVWPFCRKHQFVDVYCGSNRCYENQSLYSRI